MNISHKKLAVSLFGAATLVASGAASAAMTSIADSWHNLGAGNTKGVTPNGGSPANHSNDTGEICVFCHTPHGGDSSASVPLWNRNISTPPTYTRYSDLGTSTFDAAEAPIGSITIGCLSCHDGTQAIDAVLNAPGSGNYTAPGNAPPRLGANFVGDDQSGGKLAATNGAGAAVVQMLGTDLSNDHPVSMQYGGGGITQGNTTATVDRDFRLPTETTIGTGATVWYIEGSTTRSLLGTTYETISFNETGRDRLDIILYTRTDLGATEPFVECGSCHDPHNVDNPTFLRISNTAPSLQTGGDFNNAGKSSGGPSALCLTCHDK
jgi:hypothetical protein